jgi:hypothetical protein
VEVNGGIASGSVLPIVELAEKLEEFVFPLACLFLCTHLQTIELGDKSFIVRRQTEWSQLCGAQRSCFLDLSGPNCAFWQKVPQELVESGRHVFNRRCLQQFAPGRW